MAFEKQRPEEIVERVLRVLRGIFEPQGIEVPQPVQVTADLHPQAALGLLVANVTP